MKVWIVSHGENGEGGKVVSVHTTLDDAIGSAKQVRFCWAGGWKVEEVTDVSLRYRNGCDFVSIEEWEVQERKTQ